MRRMMVSLALGAMLFGGWTAADGAQARAGLLGVVGDAGFCASASTFPLNVVFCLDLHLSLSAAIPDPTAHVYDDPFFIGWTDFLPAAPLDYSPPTEDECLAGELACVAEVISEMTARWAPLGCHHNAVFGYTYLRTTEVYEEIVTNDPNFFQDTAFVNHEDAVFADYYFVAFDAWQAGDLDAVPPAWRIAFAAGDAGELSAMGNVFLGMNAHIRRDLPYVLAGIGLTAPDGTSRKPDHDKVNLFLAEANRYILPGVADLYDETADDGDVPGTSIDNEAAIAVVQGWREEAWRLAEELVAASTDAERAFVSAQIENSAALGALVIRAAFLQSDTSVRDAYCATQHGL